MIAAVNKWEDGIKGLSCAPGINSKESSCIASRHFSVVEAYPKDNVNTDSFGTDMKNRSLVESKYDLCLLFFLLCLFGTFRDRTTIYTQTMYPYRRLD